MKALLKIISFVILFHTGQSAFAGGGNEPNATHAMLRQATELKLSYKDAEALALVDKILAQDSANFEALCLASSLNCRIGNRFQDETKRMEFFELARVQANRALLQRPTAPEANFAMAQAISNMSKVGNAKERLTNLCKIKTYLDATLAADSLHAGAWHLLGRWNFKVANFNFAETAAAKMLVGGVPEGASNKMAVKALQKAISFAPENILYHYDLAQVLNETGDRDDCRIILEDAINIRPATNEELEVSRRCQAMLTQMSRKSF